MQAFEDEDEFLERERAAFRVIGKRIGQMMASGYEVRTFDNVPTLAHELYFIGPTRDHKHVDVKRLILPYEYISTMVAGDDVANRKLQTLLEHVSKANKDLQEFVIELVANKLKKGVEDDHSGREYQA